MSKEKTRDYIYEYTTALCSAIDILVKNTSVLGSLSYDNSDLRYALARSLYFSYISSDYLLNIFKEHKNSHAIENIKVNNLAEKELLVLMSRIPAEKIKLNTRRKIAHMVGVFIGVIIKTLKIGLLCHIARELINTLRQTKIKPDVILFAHNERFAKYMTPIANKLLSPFVFITYDKKTIKYLKEKKLPFVKISTFGYFIERLSIKKSILKSFGITDKYDLFFDSIKRMSPHTIVLVEGNSSQDEVINMIAKKLKISSVCIQQGWSPIIHNGFRNMTFSKFLTWGDGFIKLLQPFNPKENFVATGNFNIKKSEKLIGIKKIQTITFFPQAISKILKKNAWNEMLSLAKRLATQYPNIEVRIREHPNYPIDMYKKGHRAELESTGIKFLSSEKYSLTSVLESSDISVSIYSTTILESIASGVFPIILNLTHLPTYFPDINEVGAGIETKTTEETYLAICNIINKPELLYKFHKTIKIFSDEYFLKDKESALKNVLREIEPNI